MMAATSNEVKTRWNAAHYTQVKFSVPPDIAAAFKERRIAVGVSMTSEISRFMSGNSRPPKTCADSCATRQKRRRALSELIRQLDAIRDAEQQYLDNIPANLRNSRPYEAAEQTAAALEEALGILDEAY